MRKSMTIIITALMAMTIFFSCSSSPTDVKERRLKKFTSALPTETAEKFDINSEKYGQKIQAWKMRADKWIAETHSKETNAKHAMSNRYSSDTRKYVASTLTNRFYERDNPTALMNEVKVYTDEIAVELDAELEKNEKLRKTLDEIKMDEAIVAFSTEDITFYFLWNYVITIDRPRRFQ